MRLDDQHVGGRYYSLEQGVVQSLRHQILAGEFQPGQRVTVEELSQRFGVSRTPVRDAVKRLEMERLVQVVPRKHIIIRGLDLHELVHVNRIRGALEGLCAREATESMSEEQLHALTEVFVQMESALDRDDLEAYHSHHIQFHLFLIRGHQNQRLQAMVEDLYEYIALLRKVALEIPEQQVQSRFEHRSIYQAVVRGDAGKAELLMRIHVENFEFRLGKVLELAKRAGAEAEAK